MSEIVPHKIQMIVAELYDNYVWNIQRDFKKQKIVRRLGAAVG